MSRPKIRNKGRRAPVVLCEHNGKRSYRSKAKALKAARTSSVRPKLEPYVCPECGDWHLTSQQNKG